MNELKKAEAQTQKCLLYLHKAFGFLQGAIYEAENIEPYLSVQEAIQKAKQQIVVIMNNEQDGGINETLNR